MTGKELMDLPDDGHRYELVKGELRTMTPAGRKHGEIAMTLGIMLGSHIRAHRLGTVCAAETGFYLSRDPDTVRAPDVSFVAQERIRPKRTSMNIGPSPLTWPSRWSLPQTGLPRCWPRWPSTWEPEHSWCGWFFADTNDCRLSSFR